MKAIIIIYFILLAGMLLMVPVKFITSRQLTCKACHNKYLVAKKIKEYRCPHCGAPILHDGSAI